jgi:adenylate cyclase
MDVVAFTPLTERLEPEQVVEILNHLFTISTEIVFRHGGTVDKFIGDSMMAIWGAPSTVEDHALRAVEAAEDILSWLEVANQHFRERYQTAIRLAFGINSGSCVVGNIGSDTRMEYTAIGDVVNVAARLEAIARPQQILVTRSTVDQLAGRFDCLSIGTKQLSGRATELEIFEVRT